MRLPIQHANLKKGNRMSDQDREAFEDWVDHKFGGPAGRHTSRCDGLYLNASVQAAWVVWQASRDHYAPKLTEEVVEVVAKAIHHTPYTVPWEYSNVQMRENARDKAKAALRATGVRFKDEA
jgi:hypothetical protein